MLLGCAQQYFRSRFQGWVLFGIGLALISHFFLNIAPLSAQVSEMTVYTGNNPAAVMEQFLAEAPEAVDTEILVLSEAGDYAIATYRWGEGGGFVVMQQADGQWQNMCADGGAMSGGQDLVNICKVPLVDAQTLWTQFQEDSTEAGYAI